jgi:hypothetical protein
MPVVAEGKNEGMAPNAARKE